MQTERITRIAKIAEKFMNMIFPVKCVCCKELSKNAGGEDILCKTCREILISEATRDFDRNEDKKIKYVDAVIFPYFYEGDKIRQAIYAVKRANLKYINEFFAKCMYNSLKISDKIKIGEIDFITNAPRKQDSIRFYGYNQTEVLAKIISKYSGIKYVPVITASKSYDTEQKTLNHKQRVSNVKNKFVPVKNIKNIKSINIKNKNVLIIDDIITTGSTLSECARIMKNMGAEHVFALCAAGADNQI